MPSHHIIAPSPATFVLVHGTWHGGWCWKRVAEPLRAQGYRVYTPTQTGVGERSHLLSRHITLDTFVTDIVNVLEWEDLTDVILVGHSFGGIAITGTADRVPQRIRHLVYLDSLIPAPGQSPFDAIPPHVAAARRRLAQESSGGVSLPVTSADAMGVYDAADVQWLAEKLTPHPVSTYESKLELKHPVGNDLPATYVAVKPYYAPTAASRQYAQSRADWSYCEIDAGHDAMITSPQAVLAILHQCASGTPGKPPRAQ